MLLDPANPNEPIACGTDGFWTGEYNPTRKGMQLMGWQRKGSSDKPRVVMQSCEIQQDCASYLVGREKQMRNRCFWTT